MLLIWLIVWLLSGTPELAAWNAWLVSCVVCAALTVWHGSTVVYHR